MKTITVVSKDKVGLLADISYILGKRNINIDGVSVDVVGGDAIISLTLKDAQKASSALRESGYNVSESDTLFVRVGNVIGGINSLTSKLSQNRVNIENVHLVSSDSDHGVFAMNVDKPRKALRILGEAVINAVGN